MAEDVTFANGDITLAGTLTLPGDGLPRGGVVMVGGSGPADRDNDVYFPAIRPALVAAGLAVLSYDKRGVGTSGGDWRLGTLDDLAADARAAVAFLRARGVPRPGLFGHSEGGWVVLRAAPGCAAAWVVANSCPGMTPAAQDRFGIGNMLRQSGTPEADVERALTAYDAVVDAGRRGAGLAEVARLTAESRLAEYFDDLDAPSWEFLKRKQDHDPLPDLRALRCPTLLSFGGADRLVPVAQSVQLFTGVACEPGRAPGATLDIAVFPAANHRVQTAAGALAAGYLERLTGWIALQPEG